MKFIANILSDLYKTRPLPLTARGATLIAAFGTLAVSCYMPGAREAIQKQNAEAPDRSASSASSSGSSNNSKSDKKSGGGTSTEIASADGSRVENLPPLNEAITPPPYDPIWDSYMPHNTGGSPGKVYYIAPDGKDSNAGTEAAPWATLQKAANTLLPGETVLVKNGTYDETDLGPENWYHTDIRRSGSPGKYITYKNYPGHKPVIFVRSWNGLQINGASYIHIEGFEVRGIDDPDVADVKNPEHFGNGISIVDTDIKLESPTTRSHHIRIVGNHVHHVGGNGINGWGALIAGNVVHHASHRSDAGNSCISSGGNRGAASGQVGTYFTVIAGNVLYNCVNLHKFKQANMITDGNGVIIDYMKPEPHYGKSGKRILIANNIAFNNGGRGFHVYLSGYVDVINNLAIGNLRTAVLNNEAELSAVDSDNVRFVGNIAVATGNHHTINDAMSKDITWEHNVLIGKNQLRYRAKKASHPTDTVEKDPSWLKLENLSLNPSEADFRPMEGSPILDYFTHELLPKIDFYGKPRPSGAKADAGPIERQQ